VPVGRGLASFWVDGAQSSRFAMTTVQTAYIASYCFSVLLLSVGVLLMASERVRKEIRAARHPRRADWVQPGDTSLDALLARADAALT
jgi:hypothetical protein